MDKDKLKLFNSYMVLKSNYKETDDYGEMNTTYTYEAVLMRIGELFFNNSYVNDNDMDKSISDLFKFISDNVPLSLPDLDYGLDLKGDYSFPVEYGDYNYGIISNVYNPLKEVHNQCDVIIDKLREEKNRDYILDVIENNVGFLQKNTIDFIFRDSQSDVEKGLDYNSFYHQNYFKYAVNDVEHMIEFFGNNKKDVKEYDYIYLMLKDLYHITRQNRVLFK